MPCYHPLPAWRGDVQKSGKREILFKRPRVENAGLFQLKVPCGRCVGCRLERSRQWALRCMHEASMHEENIFVTLTYSEESLPKDHGLDKNHFPEFMKKLRQHLWREAKKNKTAVKKVRYYHCGEYGEKFGRPHYHAILFGINFNDRLLYKTTRRGDKLYTSETLDKLWSHGACWIGAVTFESAAYVARYVMKKVSGKTADIHYLDWQTGVIRESEYVTMSRRPGIGKKWYDKFVTDIYPRDYAILRGMKVRPPKFYDGLYELENPAEFARLKKARVAKAIAVDPSGYGENGGLRLAVKEEVKIAQMRSLSRGLEE